MMDINMVPNWTVPLPVVVDLAGTISEYVLYLII
jgi:hypothetical protein